ncbi:hypothetical protein HK405_011760, partial [Cladochytrium tenue]
MLAEQAFAIAAATTAAAEYAQTVPAHLMPPTPALSTTSATFDDAPDQFCAATRGAVAAPAASAAAKVLGTATATTDRPAPPSLSAPLRSCPDGLGCGEDDDDVDQDFHHGAPLLHDRARQLLNQPIFHVTAANSQDEEDYAPPLSASDSALPLFSIDGEELWPSPLGNGQLQPAQVVAASGDDLEQVGGRPRKSQQQQQQPTRQLPFRMPLHIDLRFSSSSRSSSNNNNDNDNDFSFSPIPSNLHHPQQLSLHNHLLQQSRPLVQQQQILREQPKEVRSLISPRPPTPSSRSPPAATRLPAAATQLSTDPAAAAAAMDTRALPASSGTVRMMQVEPMIKDEVAAVSNFASDPTTVSGDAAANTASRSRLVTLRNLSELFA